MPERNPNLPEYKVYRSRRRPFRWLLNRLRGYHPTEPKPEVEPRPERERRRWWRLLGWAALAVAGWLAVSLVLFMFSGHQSVKRVPESARQALAGGDHLLTGASTILILGSDKRPKGSKEPGANRGPSRSDTILLMRFRGSKSAKLSIPRDTQVTIPDHGVGKINSAFAIGGAALAIKTIEFNFPPIEINHIVIVNFEGFPEFVDALGGVTMHTGCIVSTFSGKTLRLRAGKHHLDGQEALQVVRTRKNRCNASEDDLTRARRQQRFLDAVKARLKSPMTFFRLPWVSWTGPGTVDADLGGRGLLTLFLEMERASSAKPAILPVVPIAGTSNLQVIKPRANEAVKRFLAAR